MKRIAYILLIYCVLLLPSFSLYARGITQEEIINNLQQATQNLENAIQSICPSDSQLKNGQCVCKEGYIFNGEACITYAQACQSKYGPHTYGDKNYCYCIEGYVWNKERTKCITYTNDCRSAYGDHVIAGKGDSQHKYYCYCEEGYVWNDKKTACIDINQWCQNKLGPNAYGDETLQCHCKDGYALNLEGTKCITYTESCYFKYGEHVIGRKGDKKDFAFCDCEEGYIWNFNKTTCITKWESIKQYFVGGGMGILISILLGLIPILIWFFVLSIAIKKTFKKSISLKRFFTFFGAGILITPLVWYGEGFYLKLLRIDMNVSLSFLNIIFVYGGIAIIEELVKFFSAYCILKRNKYFDEAIDAMIYLIVLALGFGLVENILAASQEIVNGSLLLPVFQTMSLRFVGANLLHALSSGVIGFFWALSLLKNKKPYLYWGLMLGISLHFFFNLVTIKFGGTAVFLVSLVLIALLIIFLTSLKKLSNLLQKSSS